MKSGQQSLSPSTPATNLTETLKETPPHGMKGRLEPASFISADAILVMAGVVLFVAAMISAFVFIWAKYKSRLKSKALLGNFADVPGLWAELRRSVAMIKVPSDAPSTGQKEWNQFTSDVSLHLRRAIELRTHIPVAESTTEEILRMLSSGALKPRVISEHDLKSTLSRLDAVRFGGVSMTPEEAESVLATLHQWLQRLEADQNAEVAVSVANTPVIDEKGGVRVFDT
jgi:hypothetical protein